MKEDVEFMQEGREKTTPEKVFCLQGCCWAAFVLQCPYCECSEQTAFKGIVPGVSFFALATLDMKPCVHRDMGV